MRLLPSTNDSDRERTSGSRSKNALRLVLGCPLLGDWVAAVIPVGAAPPPRPLCDACGDSFETTADAHGVAVTVEGSTATVTVRTNGSATWVVHNHLASSVTAERLRSNHPLLTTIGDRAVWDTEFLGVNAL